MNIVRWLWKVVSYPFVFMYDPDKVIRQEIEEEGPIDKDAHLSQYERRQKENQAKSSH